MNFDNKFIENVSSWSNQVLGFWIRLAGVPQHFEKGQWVCSLRGRWNLHMISLNTDHRSSKERSGNGSFQLGAFG